MTVTAPTLAQEIAKRTIARFTSGSADKESYQPQSVKLPLVDWIQSEFWIPERNHLPDDQRGLELHPYQIAVLNEAERRDPATGKYIYDIVVWSDIKKSAKSSIAAAVILYRALYTTWGSFKIVANDLKQADSRVFYYIKRAIELNTRLTSRAQIKNYKIQLDNHTVIEAIPVDPKGEAGGNDDMIEFTELHAADSKAAAQMWTEMTISPIKHGFSQRWVDTYAGHSGESPILEPLFDYAVKDEYRLTLPDAPADLELYARGAMLVLWNTRPHLAWQTPEYYASESAVLTPNEFQRMHRNQWVTSADVFVPAEWWSACQGDYPAFDERIPVVIGMDAGVSSDCFALVGVSRIGDTTYTRFCRIWKPPKGGKIDFGEVERCIRDELVKQYNVIQIAYDPYQTHDLATRLRNDGVTWMYEFTQGAPRLEADKQLYDCIRDKRIVHDGDATLREHVTNANSKSEGDVDKLRIVKRAEHLKIDACVALSMANSEIRRLNV
jgi:phage terminase large subunit-like protein